LRHRHRQQSQQQTTKSGLQCPREFEFLEQRMNAVKGFYIKAPHDCTNDGQNQVKDQFGRMTKLEIRRGKEWLPTRYRAEKGISNDGSNNAGDQSLVFEFRILIEHLDSKQGSPKGCVKGGADSAGHAGQKQSAPVYVAQFKPVGEKRTESGADLGNRTFTTGRAAGRDGGYGSQGLDVRNPGANATLLIMKGFKGTVRTMAFGFRGKSKDQSARKKAAESGDQKQEPAMGYGQGIDEPAIGGSCPLPHRRMKAGPLVENPEFAEIGHHVKGNRADSGHQSDQAAQQHEPSYAAYIQLIKCVTQR
jgi:hypothetical protein